MMVVSPRTCLCRQAGEQAGTGILATMNDDRFNVARFCCHYCAPFNCGNLAVR
jgi:hypothetical protein